MTPNIYNAYQKLKGTREPYLDYAEETSRMTIPTMSPRGTPVNKELRPHTPHGTQAVRSLASSILKSMMPPGVKWFDLDFPPEVWQQLKGQHGDTVVADIRAALDARENAIIEALNHKTARSRFGSSVQRNLVEGQTVYINKPGEIGVYPLRSFVLERVNGKVHTLIIEEEKFTSPFENVEATAGETPGGEPSPNKCVYILADFEKGEVWRQDGPKGTAKRVDDKPKDPDHLTIQQFIVSVGETPDIDDYAVGYAYNYLRLFHLLNHAESSLGEAMAAAASNWPCVRPGSPVTADDMSRKRSGEWTEATEGDLWWFSSVNKVGDWAFVHQKIEGWKNDLATVFAMGIKDRPVGADTTATEILQVIDELNTQTQTLMTSMEETFQRPLIESELTLQERVSPLFPDIAADVLSIVKVTITSGGNSIERQRSLMRFLTQVLPMLKTLDQTLVVDGKRCADALADSMLVKTEGMYSKMSPEQVQQMQMAAMGGGDTAREETIMTNGGPQPPQPAQGAPPTGG